MNFLSLIKKDQWPIISVTFIWSALSWILHFILEFSALISLGQPYYYILFHFVFVGIGGLSGLFVHEKVHDFIILAFSTVLLSISLIGLQFSTNILPLSIFLSFAGFAVGIGFSLILYQMSFMRSNLAYAGRLGSFSLVCVSPILILSGIIDNIANKTIRNWLQTSLIVLLTLPALAVIYHLRNSSLLPQKKFNFMRYLKNKENYSFLGLAFFWGFFFSNTYYGTLLVLQPSDSDRSFTSIFTNESLASFILPFFFGFIVFTLLAGILADLIGRRITILLGLVFQALAFLLLPILERNSLFVPLFPIIISIGFSFSLNTTLQLFVEIPSEKNIRGIINVAVVVFSLGLLGGLGFQEIVKQTGIGYEYLAMILLFIIVSATIIIFQLKETKPSKEELEWKNAVRYILVMSKAGVPLYSQNLSENPKHVTTPDEMLLGGALVAVSSLIQEIAENREKLKVVKQEGFSILFEEGEHSLVALLTLRELKTLRKKLEDFTIEFENFFGELLEQWSGAAEAFIPTKNLVDKYFE